MDATDNSQSRPRTPLHDPIRFRRKIAAALLGLCAPAPLHAGFSISVKLAATTVPRFSQVKATLDMQAPFADPFDPEDIRVDARLTAPSGATLLQPCFYRSGNGSQSVWEMRFAPREQGAYSFLSLVTSRTGADSSAPMAFTATASDADGFLTLAPETGYCLRFDSGRWFRGVGSNFNREDGEFSNAKMFGIFRQNKMTFMRTWSGPGNMGIESKTGKAGHIDEASAAKVDAFMALARDNGVYIMSAFDTFGGYLLQDSKFGGGGSWYGNVYSKDKGGPAASPTDFMVSAEARRIYKRRLRYTVARWGSEPNLAMWELWNEVDHLVQYSGAKMADISGWHKEIAGYLKSIDPYRHPVTTSMSYQNFAPLWQDSGIDITQMHLYKSTDDLAATIAKYERDYGKPFVAGEFSLHWEGTNQSSAASYERELHMGMWRGLFSPTPVLPLTWWWQFHYNQNDFFHFGRISDFLAKMPDRGPAPESLSVAATSDLETMGIRIGADAFLWIHNKKNSPQSASALSLPGLLGAEYSLESYDPWSGAFSPAQTLKAGHDGVSLAVPSLGPDKEIAYRLVDKNPQTSAVHRSVPGHAAPRILSLGGDRGLRVSGFTGSAGPIGFQVRTLDGRLLARGEAPVRVSERTRPATAP